MRRSTITPSMNGDAGEYAPITSRPPVAYSARNSFAGSAPVWPGRNFNCKRVGPTSRPDATMRRWREPRRRQLHARVVQDADGAEIVALVIHELQELAHALGSRQPSGGACQVQHARLDGQRGLQVAELAGHELRHLARDHQLV